MSRSGSTLPEMPVLGALGELLCGGMPTGEPSAGATLAPVSTSLLHLIACNPCRTSKAKVDLSHHDNLSTFTRRCSTSKLVMAGRQLNEGVANTSPAGSVLQSLMRCIRAPDLLAGASALKPEP